MGTVTLEPGTSAVLGRSKACDFALVDPSVSRSHASVRSEGGVWSIADESSRHGTLVNGERLEAGVWRPLGRGDQVTIGPWILRAWMGEDDPPSLSRPSTVTSASPRLVREQRGEYVEALDEAKLGDLARHRLGVLIECAATIHAAETESDLATAVVSSALSGTGYGRAALLRPGSSFSPGDFGSGSADVEVLAALSRQVESAANTSASFPVSASLMAKAASGKPARLGGIVAGEGDYGQSIADLRIHSALCAPVEVGGTIEAYLYLDARGGEGSVQADAAEFCLALARICGLAMANRQRAVLARKSQL
ncbi:MAG: hypothetical protein CMJ31_10860, partial [Phycisphaerae bacterium]|nr:hypothetical protein [Phycisphaerae bacterium]